MNTILTLFNDSAPFLNPKNLTMASTINFADSSGFPPNTPQLIAGIAMDDSLCFSASTKQDNTLCFKRCVDIWGPNLYHLQVRNINY